MFASTVKLLNTIFTTIGINVVRISPGGEEDSQENGSGQETHGSGELVGPPSQTGWVVVVITTMLVALA